MNKGVTVLIVATLISLACGTSPYTVRGEWNPTPQELRGVVLDGELSEGCKSLLLPNTFQDFELVGTWVSRYTSTDVLILREDHTYKQIYDDPITGNYFESGWQTWWVEHRESGMLYLHMQGMHKCGEFPLELCQLEEGGGGDENWWTDLCEGRLIQMRGEVILQVLSESPPPAPPSVLLHHLTDDPDSEGNVFEFLPSADLILTDSFESGDLSAWSALITDDETEALQIMPSAALRGKYGMRVSVSGNAASYVRDDTPDQETRYRAAFYLDPSAAVIPEGNTLDVFAGYNISGESVIEVFRIQLQFDRSSGYQVRAQMLKGDSSYASTDWYSINDAEHLIEIDWGNDGYVLLLMNGRLKQSVSYLGNSAQRVDQVRLGKVGGEGTSGQLYFDAFRSGRTGNIWCCEHK